MNKCWIEQYHDDIESGKIIPGPYVRIMINKLMNELHDDDIKKDFSDSNKRIHFIENECRHAQAPFAGKPFELMLWQKAIIEAFYCFKIWDDELQRYVRKYQKLLLKISRKNGKSPYISAWTLAEWFCGEIGTNVLYGSNDYEQAGL